MAASIPRCPRPLERSPQVITGPAGCVLPVFVLRALQGRKDSVGNGLFTLFLESTDLFDSCNWFTESINQSINQRWVLKVNILIVLVFSSLPSVPGGKKVNGGFERRR